MMSNFQKFELSGHLGRDPETKTSKAGNPVTTFSVAYSNGKKGDPNQRTTWFNCVAFKDTAAYIGQKYGKGDPIKITNAIIENDVWEDREGKKRDGWKVKVFDVERTDGRQENPVPQRGEPSPDSDDLDIPF